MRIYVDADACPVVRLTEYIAKKRHLPVTLLCDTNHILTSDYSEVHIIGAGSDAVDIVVTQDFGVAAMALGKGAYAIHQNGWWYTNNNIDQLLMRRHVFKKGVYSWNSKKRPHMRGEPKRTSENDEAFRMGLEQLIDEVIAAKKIQGV